MQVIYLTFEGLMSSVFDSQVLNLLEFLLHKGQLVHLVSFERYANTSTNFNRRRIGVVKRLDNNVLFVKRPPFMGKPILRILAWQLAKAIKGVYGTKEPLILHCRGQIAAYIAIQAKRLLLHNDVAVLADIRGVPEEMLLFKSTWWRWLLNHIRYREYKKIERTAYTNADKLCCVSNALRRYIVNNFNISHDKITAIHCAVNDKLFRFDNITRKKIRQELGLTDELVFVYSGSLAPWQAPMRIFEFFAAVKKIYPKSHLLILTRDFITAKKLLDKYMKDVSNITLLSLDYSKVPDYLMAADVGLLLREPTLVNKVAFPTKYAEYLSCGLFVLTTQAVEDVSAYTIAKPVIGYVLRQFPELDNDELCRLIRQLQENRLLTDAGRHERSAIAARMFGIEATFSKYLEIYDDLAKS